MPNLVLHFDPVSDFVQTTTLTPSNNYLTETKVSCFGSSMIRCQDVLRDIANECSSETAMLTSADYYAYALQQLHYRNKGAMLLFLEIC